jgi:hypothetical protein
MNMTCDALQVSDTLSRLLLAGVSLESKGLLPGGSAGLVSFSEDIDFCIFSFHLFRVGGCLQTLMMNA